VLLADPEFRRRGLTKRFNAVLIRDGEPQGYALYRIKSEWSAAGPANTVQVVEFMAPDADAAQQLWRYVFGIDLMSTIRLRLGPADQPLLLMVAEPRRIQLRISDGMWMRIVDVPQALAARGYSSDGTIVFEVADSFMPGVAGRYRLTVSGGEGRAERTTDAPDLQLEIQDLGAVYLGGFTFANLGRAGRTVECAPGARERADALFASNVSPWCPEVF
jgi:predicted acetyltransferase